MAEGGADELPLSNEEVAELEAALLEGVEAHGFDGDAWTPELVAALIERSFDVSLPAAATRRYVEAENWGERRRHDSSTDLFESVPDGLLIQDIETGEIIDGNPACLDMLGYDRGELVGEQVGTISAIESKRANDRANERIRRACDTGSVQFDCELRRKNGETFPAAVHLGTVTLDGEKRAIARVRDVSERKERKRKLRHERNLIATVFETFPEPVVHVEFVDDRPVVLTINEAFTETFGYEEDEIVGENLNEAIVPGYEPNRGPIDDRDERRPVEKEVRRVTATDERDFLFRSLPLRDQRGADAVESIGVYVDITERKATRRKLEALNTRFQLALEATDTGVWEWDLETDEVIFDEASERLFGFAPGEFPSTDDAFADRIHPEDLPAVEREKAAAIENDAEYRIDFRVRPPDGPLRWIQARGIVTGDDTADRILGIQTDITERKQYERELEWERALNRNVQEALVRSHTRAELEETIATQLQRQGYDLVWIAERDERRLEPRVIRGDEAYVERIDRSVAGEEPKREPCVRAATAGEPRFVHDFSTAPEMDWSETALGAGYGSGAGLPLVYDDVSYGTLGVYHAQGGRFDESERRLLCELADNVAFAIHSLETESALASDHNVEVSLTINAEAYYLVSVAQNGPLEDCDRVCVDGTVKRGADSALQYVTVEGGSIPRVREALAEHPSVSDVTVVAPGEPTRLQVTVDERVPEAQLASRGATVRSTVVGIDGATLTLHLPAKKDVRSIVDELEETFGTIAVRSVVTSERSVDDALTETLTEKQATTLKAAYHHGYFEQPRESSATEVGESLGISHSTFLQHLRAAQRKTFGQRFE